MFAADYRWPVSKGPEMTRARCDFRGVQKHGKQTRPANQHPRVAVSGLRTCIPNTAEQLAIKDGRGLDGICAIL